MSREKINMTGQRFGLLVVQREAGRSHGRVCWSCACDCGRTKVIDGSVLRQGRSASCGCISHQLSSSKISTHGHARKGRHTPEYGTWTSMIGRCSNPENKSYADYGGRGIVVCDRWLTSFQAFLDDMGYKPSPDHSIERIDNDGNYEPSNCRWATAKEQATNRRPRRRGYHRRKKWQLSDSEV